MRQVAAYGVDLLAAQQGQSGGIPVGGVAVIGDGDIGGSQHGGPGPDIQLAAGLGQGGEREERQQSKESVLHGDHLFVISVLPPREIGAGFCP